MTARWTHQPGDTYHVTGFYYNTTRRFKTIVTDSWWYADGINLWRGSVWHVRDGKRKLVKRID